MSQKPKPQRPKPTKAKAQVKSFYLPAVYEEGDKLFLVFCGEMGCTRSWYRRENPKVIMYCDLHRK